MTSSVWWDRAWVYGWFLMATAAEFWRGPLDALAVRALAPSWQRRAQLPRPGGDVASWARIATPLTRARKTLPSFEQTFRKLRDALEDFDVSKVRYDDIQRSAIMAAPAVE